MDLEVKNIYKSFGSNNVLKDVSFKAESGKTLGMLGRNGSGKTTTIRIIMDIFSADSGEVIIDGVKNTQSKLKIGYLPEERGLYPKRTISEQMVYFGELRGLSRKEAKNRSYELLEKLEAQEYYKKKLDTLSKGNQQKIQLAIALINDPDIVILDEPFSGLDPINAKILKNLISETVSKNKIVLFSSHQMSSIEEFCDDICLINNGTISLTGNLREIKKQYPRNKISIVPEGNDTKALKAFIKNSAISQLISNCKESKNSCIITLNAEDDKNQILRILADHNDIKIDSFAIIEPSLEEIFIEKAGEHTNE